MTDNTPDYEDNLYFDCKNCKMTDEYCPSGDCPTSQSPRNHLATKPQAFDLTEQWKKGELPSGWYYLKVNEELANCPVISECVVDYNLGLPISYFYDFDVAKIEQVLAPVPTFEEWQAKLEENAQLKELLKECSIANMALVSIMDWLRESTIPEQRENCEKLFEKTQELQKQLDEVLK